MERSAGCRRRPATCGCASTWTGWTGPWSRPRTTFRVLSAAPTVRLIDPPTRAVVGEPVRVPFEVTTRARRGGQGLDPLRHRVHAALPDPRRDRRRRVDPRDGGPGGSADHRARTAGADRQQEAALRRRAQPGGASSSDGDASSSVPDVVTVGIPSEFAFSADGCRVAVARIEGPGERSASGGSPAPRAERRSPGRRRARAPIVLTVIARGRRPTRPRRPIVLSVGGTSVMAEEPGSSRGNRQWQRHLLGRGRGVRSSGWSSTAWVRSSRCSSRWSGSGSA